MYKNVKYESKTKTNQLFNNRMVKLVLSKNRTLHNSEGAPTTTATCSNRKSLIKMMLSKHKEHTCGKVSL